MPDADDFDVESLRALLRGESPRPEKPAAGSPGTAAAPKKATAASRPKAAKAPARAARRKKR